MRMFDTDVSVDIVRGLAPAVLWFNALPEPAFIAGFAYMEIIEGCKDKAEIRRVRLLLSPLNIIWPREEDCKRGLADFTQYHLSHRLGLIDALIAATAMGQGATLCTFNVKHFSAVPGLVIEQPYSRM